MTTFRQAADLLLDPTNDLDQPTIDRLVERFGELDVADLAARNLVVVIPEALQGMGKTKAQLRGVLREFGEFLAEVRGLGPSQPAGQAAPAMPTTIRLEREPELDELDIVALLGKLGEADDEDAQARVLDALMTKRRFAMAYSKTGGRLFLASGGVYDRAATGRYVNDLAAGSAPQDWVGGVKPATWQELAGSADMVVIDPFTGVIYPVGAKDADGRVVSDFKHLAALIYALVEPGEAHDWRPVLRTRHERSQTIRDLMAEGSEREEPWAPIIRAFEYAKTRPGDVAGRIHVPMTRDEASRLLGADPSPSRASSGSRGQVDLRIAAALVPDRFTDDELAELARIFSTWQIQRQLLEGAGFDVASLPSNARTAREFWYEVNRHVQANGGYGVAGVLLAAHARLPGNAVFLTGLSSRGVI